jgi:hypothetical protein
MIAYFMISALLSSAAFLPLSGTPPAPKPRVTSLPEKHRMQRRMQNGVQHRINKSLSAS